MEILIKNYHGTNYVWKTAEYADERYYVDDERYGRERVRQTGILSVKDDPRVGHVICGNCGEMIENNPEAIERHYAEQEANANCLECGSLVSYGNKSNRKVTYTKNNDGTYRVEEQYDSKLACDYDYWNRDINSKDVKAYCPHYQCRRHGVQQFKDIFVNYPEPFVRQPTVDMLNKKKYPYIGYSDGFFKYDMKVRSTLTAMVNDLGIIDHFRFDKGGWIYRLYYSDKHNRLFFADSDIYKTNIYSIMTEAKEKQILKKISELYEEAKTNE